MGASDRMWPGRRQPCSGPLLRAGKDRGGPACKAEESLGHPVGENRLHVELALLASQWLGAAGLRRAGAPAAGRRDDARQAERSMPG